MFVDQEIINEGLKPKDFRDRKLIFLDLEMTGLDPDIHEIIEVGWLIVEAKTFKILSMFESKIKPEHLETADQEALKVAGYSKSLWKKAGNLKSVMLKLSRVAPNAMLAGNAIHTDWLFLQKAFTKLDITPTFSHRLLSVDSMVYAVLFKESRVKSMGMRSGAADYFGIEFPEKHSALADAKLSYEVFRKLMGI